MTCEDLQSAYNAAVVSRDLAAAQAAWDAWNAGDCGLLPDRPREDDGGDWSNSGGHGQLPPGG